MVVLRSQKWAYVRIITGTILGGILGFYVMDRMEKSYKVRVFFFFFEQDQRLVAKNLPWKGTENQNRKEIFFIIIINSRFWIDTGENEREIEKVRERIEEERGERSSAWRVSLAFFLVYTFFFFLSNSFSPLFGWWESPRKW